MQKNSSPSISFEKADAITIIGAGNMGTSLLGGLIAKHYPANKITLTDVSLEKLNQLKNQFNVQTTMNNIAAIKTASSVVFAVKPAVFAPIAKELVAEIQQQRPLVISIAAGILEADIQQWLGGEIPIIRCMPNTPALIGCGATALFANRYVTKTQKNFAEAILRAVGIIIWLDDEKLMDAVTALSGSGPAYFFLVMEALVQAGEKLGLPPEIARLLTLQTAYGAGRMALESEKNIMELRAAVTSPGGTTEQAIKVLENAGIREIMANTLYAAKKRAEELSKETHY